MQQRTSAPNLLSRSRIGQWFRFLTLAVIAVVITLSQSSSVLGQLPPSLPGQSADRPAVVRRFGSVEVAPVRLDGDVLFNVVAPTVRNRNNPDGQIPVEVRAESIEANLNRVIATEWSEGWARRQQQRGFYTNFDPKTLQVGVAQLNGITIITASDAQRSQPLELVTVTRLDANYYGLTIEELANEWNEILSRRLLEELRERSPDAIKEQLRIAVGVAGLVVILSISVWLLQRLLTRRRDFLKARQDAEAPTPPEPLDAKAEPARDDLSPSHVELLATVRRQFSLRRRISVLGFFSWLSRWLQGVIWLGGTAIILLLFPYTKGIALQALWIPFQLLMIWFAVGIINRLGDIVIDRSSETWEDFVFAAVEDAQRKSLRVSTTVAAMKGLKTFIVWSVGIGSALSLLGAPIGSVLAGGAILAFAVSLGAQNLVKDLINGCLILWEDQFAIGDVIQIGNEGGLVENMNLRMTQLRNGEGQLITIPNSSISQVRNLTRSWSRVDFSIEVAYDADVDEALEVMRQVATQMYDEPEWRDRMPDPPEVLGVDQLAHTGMLIRVWLKTRPLEQWKVGREFRRRIRRALAEHHIPIGMPQQATRYQEDELAPLVEAFSANPDGQGAKPSNGQADDRSSPQLS